MNRRHFIKLLAAVPALAALPLDDLWKKVAPTGPISQWPVTQTLTKGDIFTIEGTYAINPMTREPLPFLQNFVVTADVTSSGMAQFSPHIYDDGPYQNVAVRPDDSAQINPLYVGRTIPTELVWNH